MAAEHLVLFIHGLGGNARTTWGQLPVYLRQSPEVVPDIDVDYFSYPTSLFRLPFGRKAPTIQELAAALGTRIDGHYASYKTITLVGHSLGGLVARRFLVDRIRKGTSLRVVQLVTYATPNSGSAIANLAGGFAWHHGQLKQLEQDADFFEALDQSWLDLKIADYVPYLQIVGSLDRVVAQAALQLEGSTVETLADRGHANIVKPRTPEDDSVRILARVIQERIGASSAVVVDLAHGQDEWNSYRTSIESLVDGCLLLESSFNASRHLVEAAKVLVLALPFQKPFTGEECDFIADWVERGGGVWLMGYYAADTHHKSNPSRLGRLLGFEFRNDLLSPPGASEGRSHVFSFDAEHHVSVDTRSHDHPLLEGVEAFSVMSACSIYPHQHGPSDLVVTSPGNTAVWHPHGPQGPEGWEYKQISSWQRDRDDAAVVLYAGQSGKGRFVATSSWKIPVLKTSGNDVLVRNIVKWLHG